MFPWLVLLLAVVLLALLCHWLLIATEGAFLGRRLVIWLYDITAHRYHKLKAFEAGDEQFFVARPIMAAVATSKMSGAGRAAVFHWRCWQKAPSRAMSLAWMPHAECCGKRLSA
jgi:hypothetical protein